MKPTRMNPTNSLLPGALAGAYITHPMHYLNASGALDGDGPNIGRRGRNLTITFLSLNRASLSSQLMTSLEAHLPEFAGELLIVDQGSDPKELQILRATAEQLRCRWRIVELDANYGVGGGRNRTMEHVRTDWVMCLDNDMVFIADPLEQIQQDLATLGCHFLNLPLLDYDRQRLYARGGHLFTDVSDGKLYVGGGPAYEQCAFDGQVGPAFLSTFMFGGASVMKVATFQAAGGYDENMFVGFEDTDFSVELFQRGYKIGNTGIVALVHDHPPPSAGADVDYEKQRYSRSLLKQSADYLERKRGIIVWSGVVDDWLAARQEELGISEAPGAAKPAAETRSPVSEDPRPRVALLLDSATSPGWDVSQALIQRLSEWFNFEVLITRTFDNIAQTYFVASEFDLVHTVDPLYAQHLRGAPCQEYVRGMGIPFEHYRERVVLKPAFSTCMVEAHLVTAENLEILRGFFADYVDAFYVNSDSIATALEAAEFPTPLAVLPAEITGDTEAEAYATYFAACLKRRVARADAVA